MTFNIKSKVGIAALAFVAVLLFAGVVFAAIAPTRFTNKPTGNSELYPFFTATTTNATSNVTFDGSGAFNIAGAKKVEVYFSRTGNNGNQGASTFTIEGTPDGTNWYAFNKLVQATSTAMQATGVIAQATTTITFGLNLDYDPFLAIRCKVVETTDGEHTCKAYAEF